MLSIQWSSDSSFLASVSRYSDIILCKPSTGTIISKFEEGLKNEGYRCLKLSKDNSTLVAGTHSGKLAVFDINKRTMVGSLVPLHKKPVNDLILHKSVVLTAGDK